MVTLGEVLAFPQLRRGEPVVLAGQDQLDRVVEWVHTTELTDIARVSRHGDLVLTTGIAMPEDDAELEAFGQELAAAGVAGLVVELGRRWSTLPEALIRACREHQVPLVELHREVRFASVTQAVCEQLVEAHVSELREHQRIDAVFTELSLKEVAPEEILSAVQSLTAASVVLESEGHNIMLFHEGPSGGETFLEDWTRRSGCTKLEGRTSWDPSNGWLLTRLGRADRPWGRLVLEAPTPPCRRDYMVVERAAAALTMHGVYGTDRRTQVRRRHHAALSALLGGAQSPEARRRATSLEFPATRHQYAGLVISPTAPAATVSSRAHVLDEIVKCTLRAAEISGTTVLVAAFDGHVKALLALDERASADEVVDRVYQLIADRVCVSAGAGSAVSDLSQADQTLQEAGHALAGHRHVVGTGVQRLTGLRVRGLLALMSDDDRLDAFARRQLAPLQGAERGRGQELLRTLEVLLEEWGSKSAAASRLNISRSVLYERIERIERLILSTLDDPEVRTSLHLALMYLHMAERRPPLSAVG